ncbi:MAG TPA: hypothetical protein ENN13_04445 [Candidatus Altiarchaeales archaeon]|nr:hypothetical protein [Candidatus Altiarchaeales archaeon]
MRCLTLILAIMLLTATVSADKILFYEVGTSSQYIIESGYSEYAEELRRQGNDVATITRGELTRETLENYDILVVQNLGKAMTAQEISAIIWFVIQRGRGLFINGEGNGNANQLTIPFGVTIDTGKLIDTTDPVSGEASNKMFTVDRFSEESITKTLRQGVVRIGFYDGSGLMLSGNAIAVATGDSDTFSDTGSFPSGSIPAVSAASRFGNGLVFIHSDADMLSNKRIGEYHNRNYGLNIIRWLKLQSSIVPEGRTQQELKVIWGELNIEIKILGDQQDSSQKLKAALLAENAGLEVDKALVNSQVKAIEDTLIGPFSKKNWAMMFLGLAMIIASAIGTKRKRKESPAKGKKAERSLGYEIGKAEEDALEKDIEDLEI